MANPGYKTLGHIIVFLSLFAIFSSNLFVNKGSSTGLGDFLDNLFDEQRQWG